MFRPKFRITLETYLTEKAQSLFPVEDLVDEVHSMMSHAIHYDELTSKAFENMTLGVEEIPSKFGWANNKRWIHNTFEVQNPAGGWIFRWTYEECVDFMQDALSNKYFKKSAVKSWSIIRIP